MDPFNFIMYFVGMGASICLPLVPLWLVWVTAGVIALRRWAKHPHVSLLLLSAIALLLIFSLVNATAVNLLPNLLPQIGLPIEQFSLILRGLSIFFTLLNAIAWGLTLWAALGWRKNDL